MAKEEASELLSIEGREVRITHPDKIYFSQTTISKLDLVHYYLSVAPGAVAGVLDMILAGEPIGTRMVASEVHAA